MTVYFSSDRDPNHDWVIYSVPARGRELSTTPPGGRQQRRPRRSRPPATELSAVAGQEAHNDYSPSAAPDGNTVVFNRDNTSIDTLWAPTGASSTCTLYAPPEGLAGTGPSEGPGSRAVFDPADPSKLVFVGADDHLHLLSGISFLPGSNPCHQTGLSDTDLSAEAFPSTSPYSTGDDAHPDWSPDGQQLIFDSTRGGGDTLFIIDLTGATPTGYPIWPSLAAAHRTISTEPVFSPDGTEIAFVQPHKGRGAYDEMLVTENDGSWQGDGPATDLTVQRDNGVSFDSEPDWQAVPGSPSLLPESPYTAALPGAALLTCASLLGLRHRRGRRRAARAREPAPGLAEAQAS
jgi:hypothetical protein